PCSKRSNSNATCCGRCWMRSIMPMWRRNISRPAPSCRRTREEERLSDPSTVIAAEARPRLRRGVRRVRNEAPGGRVLVAPERVFKADPIAAEIIKRCTGEVTFGELVDDLAKTYTAPREKILADVGTLLRGLADKKLLEV